MSAKKLFYIFVLYVVCSMTITGCKCRKNEEFASKSTELTGDKESFAETQNDIISMEDISADSQTISVLSRATWYNSDGSINHFLESKNEYVTLTAPQ